MPTNLPARRARTFRFPALPAPPMLLIVMLLTALTLAVMITHQERLFSTRYNSSLPDYAATMM